LALTFFLFYTGTTARVDAVSQYDAASVSSVGELSSQFMYTRDTELHRTADSPTENVRLLVTPPVDIEAQVSAALDVKQTPHDILAASEKHLDTAKVQLDLLNKDLLLQASQFILVVHEPELWHRSFPTLAYHSLLTSFQSVYRSGRAVNSGCRELSVIVVQMLERSEDVSSHLSLLTYLSDHLFLVTTKANDALTMAHDALKR
jgi:hypothetical protein